jgi:N-acetylmuramoyl-L-alanine amidase
MRPLLGAALVVAAVTLAGITVPKMADLNDPVRSTGTPGATQRTTPRPTGPSASPAEPRPSRPQRHRTRAGKPATPPRGRAPAEPLRAVTIALDPGHQLGNHRFPDETNALVPAGGFEKPCNTTGTATDSGIPEATVTFDLARAVEQRLEALGATVRMTRRTNSEDRWGPCVNTRGQFGERVGARLMVSLHADGSSAPDHGFHVIAPTRRAPWTTDIAGSSLRLATSLRDALEVAGLPPSNYTGGGTGLNVRDDLGTLNLSDVPVAMVEIGNMRNSGDASRMTSTSGRARQADALVRGIRTFLGR